MGFQDDPYFRWLPDRFFMRDRARDANATVMKTTVYWFNVAPRRPARREPVRPRLPVGGPRRVRSPGGGPRHRGDAHDLGDAELGGRRSQPDAAAPCRPDELRAGAVDALLGRFRGFPFVRFYSIWNEPNLNLFLTPQYDARGRSLAPTNYGRLYRAGYAGIKAGSRTAVIALGETSARGLSTSASHTPGRFAELLSKTRPRLRFDAWAHHPYPTTHTQPPTQRVRWPNVSMTSLPRFGLSLDKWFGKNIPLWITEYGHETRPEDPRGVPYAVRASCTSAPRCRWRGGTRA